MSATLRCMVGGMADTGNVAGRGEISDESWEAGASCDIRPRSGVERCDFKYRRSSFPDELREIVSQTS